MFNPTNRVPFVNDPISLSGTGIASKANADNGLTIIKMTMRVNPLKMNKGDLFFSFMNYPIWLSVILIRNDCPVLYHNLGYMESLELPLNLIKNLPLHVSGFVVCFEYSNCFLLI